MAAGADLQLVPSAGLALAADGPHAGADSLPAQVRIQSAGRLAAAGNIDVVVGADAGVSVVDLVDPATVPVFAVCVAEGLLLAAEVAYLVGDKAAPGPAKVLRETGGGAGAAHAVDSTNVEGEGGVGDLPICRPIRQNEDVVGGLFGLDDKFE